MERATRIHLAVHLDPTAVCMDNCLHKCQPKSCAGRHAPWTAGANGRGRRDRTAQKCSQFVAGMPRRCR